MLQPLFRLPTRNVSSGKRRHYLVDIERVERKGTGCFVVPRDILFELSFGASNVAFSAARANVSRSVSDNPHLRRSASIAAAIVACLPIFSDASHARELLAATTGPSSPERSSAQPPAVCRRDQYLNLATWDIQRQARTVPAAVQRVSGPSRNRPRTVRKYTPDGPECWTVRAAIMLGYQ